MTALKGSFKVLDLSEFRDNPHYAQRILHSWIRNLNHTIAFFFLNKWIRQDEPIVYFTVYVIKIISGIMGVDGRGIELALKTNGP